MKRLLAVGIVGLAMAIAGSVNLSSQQPAHSSSPTFTKDIAPIMFKHCVQCHRPGEVAPMSLLSYEEVRPWARAIKSKTASREMPPWGADPDQGLKMRNDPSLSKTQIDMIAAWVDAGAPRGNAADLPPAPRFAEGWTYGREPDYVLEMPVEFDIPAEGELGVQMFYTKVPFEEDRFAEILEIRPGNRAAVHHAGVFVVDIPEGATLVNGRLIGKDGNVIADRGSPGLPNTAGMGLPGASKLLSWVPGRGVDQHLRGGRRDRPARAPSATDSGDSGAATAINRAAAVMAVIAYLWKGQALLALIIGTALVVNMLVAAVVGVTIPIALKTFRIDPAIASSVIITTFTDVCGFFSFLGLATLLIRFLL